MNKKISHYLELAARWHVFFLLFIYGSGKLLGGQFYRRGHLPDEIANTPLIELSGFDLAWSFMGYSYGYILFIGISQLLGAFLLLFEKTKLLGVLILIPILTNIIVFDMIFFDKYGALASAILYFLLLLLILYFNKDKLKKAIQSLTYVKKEPTTFVIMEKWKTVLIVALIIGIIFGVEQIFVNLLGH